MPELTGKSGYLKVAYTWRWYGTETDIGETLVTIEFSSQDNNTEVTVTHDLFPDERALAQHREGWRGCLEQLQALV